MHQGAFQLLCLFDFINSIKIVHSIIFKGRLESVKLYRFNLI